MSRKHDASVMGGVQGNREGGSIGRRETVDTAVEESRKETAHRLARYQADERTCLRVIAPQAATAASKVLSLCFTVRNFLIFHFIVSFLSFC